MRVEQVWFECRGARLYGEVHVPDVVPAPAVLVCHGLNARGFHQLRVYDMLAEAACRVGFVALVFDFQGVGKSGGRFDYGVGEREDVRCALDYLCSRKDVVGDQVYVVGHSLGGAVSLYALRGESRVRGLVLWSVPKNHDYNVRKFIRNSRVSLGLWLFLFLSRVDRVFNVSRLFRLQVYGVRLRPREVLGKLMRLDEVEAVSKLRGIPVLVVNGERDSIVGVDEAEAVFEAANDPKRLMILEGADHVFKGKEEELIQKTMGWIDELERR